MADCHTNRRHRSLQDIPDAAAHPLAHSPQSHAKPVGSVAQFRLGTMISFKGSSPRLGSPSWRILSVGAKVVPKDLLINPIHYSPLIVNPDPSQLRISPPSSKKCRR